MRRDLPSREAGSVRVRYVDRTAVEAEARRIIERKLTDGAWVPVRLLRDLLELLPRPARPPRKAKEKTR